MIANHVHDALAQVRRLQELILDRRYFQGYSGSARIGSAAAMLVGVLILDSGWVPREPLAHLAGWGAILGVALVLNYSCLAWWYLFNPEVRRNPALLKPALDALPALAVGGVLSLALVRTGQYDLLFGVWLSLYGLAQVAYRRSLPPGIYCVGIGYIACGAAALLWQGVSFLQPLPTGLVFSLGEAAGGAVLISGTRRQS